MDKNLIKNNILYIIHKILMDFYNYIKQYNSLLHKNIFNKKACKIANNIIINLG